MIFFMFVAGINFTLHYHALHGRVSAYWQSEEFRFYLGLVLVATLIIFLANWKAAIYTSLGETMRTAAFQVVSIITTTGFGTADFDKWPSLCKVLLVSLMFIGGCAGSTGGGIKVVRLLLFLKYARLQLRKLVHPHEVSTIKIGQVKVPEEVMVGILGFLALYVAFCALASFLVTALGVDMVTGVTAVIATLNNIGPGLNGVGPAQNFGALPGAAKVVLIFCMLAGRLELYTVVVLLTPDFWKMARKPKFRKFNEFKRI
jgi:trk system potassium uptake protein TrkH